MDARALYREGRLKEAVEAASAETKRHPADESRRGFLAELLMIDGAFERADTHLDLLQGGDQQAAPAYALIRQMARAEQWRRQFWAEGRVPEFIGLPDAEMQLRLKATVALRSGQPAEAVKLLEEASALRKPVAGTCGGKAFDDFRDLDDVCAGFLEVLTSTGKYFWIPTAAIESMEFHAPTRPRDLVWRRVRMSVRGGPDGEVFVPSVYGAGVAGAPDAIKLALSTDWKGGDGSPVQGSGQRMFLVGEDAVAVNDLTEVRFGGAEA
jgi:type VI secretion system protein ImpE